MARLFALFALLLAPSAHAEGRLVQAFSADSEIQSTGNGFAWTTADHRVRVTDARGRILHDVQPGSSCHTPSATPGVALIVCGATDDTGITTAWLLDSRIGALTSRAIRGEPRRIGRWWIESRSGRSLIFTDWRTGEEHASGAPAGAPPRDLDDPQLGVAQRPYRRRGSALLIRRGDRFKEVARCRGRCGDIQVWLRRVAYVDPGRGLLIERRPRSTRRWRLPPSLRDATLHRARNALVFQSGKQVWRAQRR